MPDPDPLLTRQTLIVRLRDSADDSSWAEFAEIYTPLLYAYCQKRELRHADAADIVQDVMRSISRALGKQQYDPAKGKFRAWLFTCMRNAIVTHFKKRARLPLSVAETAILDAADSSPSTGEEQAWEQDYQRQLVTWAIEKIQPEFTPHIWRAFEMTVLKDKSPSEASAETGMSNNAIAVAKHRVLTRLRAKAQSVDEDEWEQEMVERHRAG